MLILRAIRKVPSCVDFRAEGVFCEKLLTEAMKNGLGISFPRKSGYTMRGTVQAAEYRSLCKIARRLGLKMRIEKKHGIYFTLKRHRDKIGFAAGAIFAAAVVLTVLCIRLRDREKLRKDRADRSAPQEQEGRET